jgi:Eukaryotic aspartyl protease
MRILPGAQIIAQEFTVASETSQMDVGLIGVGLGSSFFNNETPPNVIDSMAAQSIISSRAFSMDLGSVDTAAGKEGRTSD